MASMQGAEQGAAAGAAFGPWGAVIGGVAGAFMGGGGGDAAAQQQAQNLQSQQQMYQQQDPFSAGGNRAQYVPQLNALQAGGPASVGSDPMFQKMNEQSLGNVQRLEASRGQSGSGQEMTALRDTGFNNQMDYFNNQYSRLAGLSGESSGRTSPIQGQSPGAAYDQKMNTMSSQLGSFGQALGGLSSIFGKGAGGGQDNTQASNQYSNAYSGDPTSNVAQYGST